MASTSNWQEQPIELPLIPPPVPPTPVAGCIHCDLLAMTRDRARANGDGSGVSDCNVRLRRHLADAHEKGAPV